MVVPFSTVQAFLVNITVCPSSHSPPTDYKMSRKSGTHRTRLISTEFAPPVNSTFVPHSKFALAKDFHAVAISVDTFFRDDVIISSFFIIWSVAPESTIASSRATIAQSFSMRWQGHGERADNALSSSSSFFSSQSCFFFWSRFHL